MHWEAVEVLTLVSGVITAGGFLVLPGADAMTRLRGAGAGAFFVAYAVWMANQSSGIVLVPVVAWVIAVVTLVLLYGASLRRERS